MYVFSTCIENLRIWVIAVEEEICWGNKIKCPKCMGTCTRVSLFVIRWRMLLEKKKRIVYSFHKQLVAKCLQEKVYFNYKTYSKQKGKLI